MGNQQLIPQKRPNLKLPILKLQLQNLRKNQKVRNRNRSHKVRLRFLNWQHSIQTPQSLERNPLLKPDSIATLEPSTEECIEICPESSIDISDTSETAECHVPPKDKSKDSTEPPTEVEDGDKNAVKSTKSKKSKNLKSISQTSIEVSEPGTEVDNPEPMKHSELVATIQTQTIGCDEEPTTLEISQPTSRQPDRTAGMVPFDVPLTKTRKSKKSKKPNSPIQLSTVSIEPESISSVQETSVEPLEFVLEDLSVDDMEPIVMVQETETALQPSVDTVEEPICKPQPETQTPSEMSPTAADAPINICVPSNVYVEQPENIISELKQTSSDAAAQLKYPEIPTCDMAEPLLTEIETVISDVVVAKSKRK